MLIAILRGSFVWLISILMVLGWNTSAAQKINNAEQNHLETELHRIVQTLQQDDFAQALTQIDTLLQRHPNFQAGWVIRGDMLKVMAGEWREQPSSLSPSRDNNVRGFRDEVISRINASLRTIPEDAVPIHVLQLADDEPEYLLADLEHSRLYLLSNPNAPNPAKLLGNYYMSQGINGADKLREGDNRTPIGIYEINQFLSKASLNDFYGEGAFPMNYPNTWDRLLGKTGSGIWIHGVPADLYSRPPNASNGCIVVANQDLLQIKAQIMRQRERPNITIVVAAQVEWVSRSALAESKKSLQQALEQWRQDWSAINTPRYLAHYADDYRSSDGMNLSQWRNYKTQVNRGKSHINVQLQDISMFRTPNDKNLYWLRFTQHYSSPNFNETSQKEQYWRKTEKGWQIVYEGRVR